MTEQEFLQRTQEQLKQLRGEQQRLHERLATDMRQMSGLRVGLGILAGTLALSLGLSLGYQIGRR